MDFVVNTELLLNNRFWMMYAETHSPGITARGGRTNTFLLDAKLDQIRFWALPSYLMACFYMITASHQDNMKQ